MDWQTDLSKRFVIDNGSYNVVFGNGIYLGEEKNNFNVYENLKGIYNKI